MVAHDFDFLIDAHPADDAESDPAPGPFLDLLARDIAGRPEALATLSPDLVARIERVIAGVAADPDAPLEGEVAL